MSSIKHRHLGVKSSHRSAILRNLVTSLIENETLRTTWPRAKEAQRMAEKLITLGKRNTDVAKKKAQAILFRPEEFVPKVFGPLRERYANRPGGYTRVMRTEPLDRDRKHAPDERDYNPGQPDSAILELVDGPKDMRFAITARAWVRHRQMEDQDDEGGAGGAGGGGLTEALAASVRKVTRFREDGEDELEREVLRLEKAKRRESRLAAQEGHELEEGNKGESIRSRQGNYLKRRRRF